MAVMTALAGQASVLDSLRVDARLGYTVGGTLPTKLDNKIRHVNNYDLGLNFAVSIEADLPLNKHWGLHSGLRYEIAGMDVDSRVKNYDIEVVRGDESLKGEPLLRGANGLCVYPKAKGGKTLRLKDANGWWPEEKVLAKLKELPKPAPQQTDFIDSCKNRKTFALNESNGFRSCTMFNLGIAAERLGRGFEFDPVTLHAKNDPAADRFLYQSMRSPWDREMQA